MKRILYILSAILLTCACSEPIVETFGNISGIVRDSRTNEPVEGVKITLTPTGSSQVTDSEGAFLFDNLDPQEFTLMFTKNGFETTSQKVSVKPGLSTSVQVVLSQVKQILRITPEELNFGKVQNSIRITLENPSSENLNWSVKSSNSWLTVSQESGSVSSKAYINAIVSRSGLAAGDYDGSLTFSAGGLQTVIPASMSIAVNEKPTITAENYASLTSNSVTLSGTLISIGSSEVTSYGFCWATHSEPTINDKVITLGDSQVAKPFEAVITDLESNTRYYFRAYAENSVGVSYSSLEIMLTTKHVSAKPSVTTGSVTNIAQNSATVAGKILSTGNATVTSYGHVWSTSAEPTLETGRFSDLGTATMPKDFISDITELAENTTYYVRAYARNEVGICYGNVEMFKTQLTSAKPSVTTGSVTNIAQNSATVAGKILSTGNATVTSYGHVWSTSAEPTLETGRFSDLGTATMPKDFTSDITGLAENTTYYVRAYARNEVGVCYGNAEMFKTQLSSTKPNVSTGSVTGITQNSATVAGKILSTGNATVTNYGHVWSTSAEPTLETGRFSDLGTATMPKDFTSNITGLAENTTYYVRAYARNEVGVCYGNVVTFSIESLNPTSGLYAYYTFENTTSNTVEGAPNAVGINSPTYTAGVGSGYGLKFSAGSNSSLNVGEAMIDTKFFTISFWIKGIGDGLIFRVLPSSSARYSAISHAMAMINGKIKYSQSGYMWQYREYEDQVFPPFLHNTLSNSSWHHIALTSDFISGYDDVVAKLYINGEYMDTVTLGQEGSTNGFGTKFIFGGNFSNNYLTLSALSMTIDNLRIYNTRVLSAQEIKNIYNYEK